MSPIYILDVIGAVGDSVCSEPVVRYAIRNLHGKDVRILTNHPKIFQHLERPMISNLDGVPLENRIHLFNRPEMYVDGKFQLHPLTEYAPPLLVHAVDFISMIMLRRTLPDEDKKIKLTFVDQTEKLEEKMGISLSDLVLLHGGTGATDQIRNFPELYNRRLQEGLSRAGFKVALIGKASDRGPYPLCSYYPTRNLVDQLNWDELLTVISRSKLLITNDSAPVHIASVFDNWMIVIPTIRHPDRLIHPRHGNRYYKAHALFKSMILDDSLEVPVNQFLYHYVNWSDAEKRREEHLPDVDYVIDTALNRCFGEFGEINPQ